MRRALVTNKITGARHVPSRLNPGQGAGSQLQNNLRSDIIIEPYGIYVNGILLLNTYIFNYMECLKRSGW